MTDKKQDKTGINTDGGAYVGGDVNTQGGDFVGRDKNISAAPGGIVIGGNATGSTIIAGNGNTVNSTVNKTENVFAPVYQAIQVSGLAAQAQENVIGEVKEIETEVVKGAQADPSFLARRLRSLRRMTPQIAEVAFAALTGPGAAVTAIVKQVAEKVKGEG